MNSVYPSETSSSTISPYHLSQDQVRFFDEHGYLVLRQWIPQFLLQRLQAAAQTWVEDGWIVYHENPETSLHNKGDFHFARRGFGDVMYRVNYVHNKGQAASLELLGSPYVLGVAESLCGPNFVPTYESMVFKAEGDGEVIRWHQDAVHPRAHRIFNFDLYLDGSLSDGGALRVIPGSQYVKQDICQVTEENDWDAPNLVTVEMQPGDVLLHDVMVVHGSPAVEGNHLRRTIYYEFRAAEQIMSEGPWDHAWIDRRLRLVPLALRQFEQAFPEEVPFEWRATDEFRPAVSDNHEAELRVVHEIHTPGTYCSAGDVPLKAKA